MYKVSLTYFKETGKFYTGDHYVTEKEHIWEIFEEMRQKSKVGDLPGMMPDCYGYYILVYPEDHPHGHPALILPSYPEESYP